MKVWELNWCYNYVFETAEAIKEIFELQYVHEHNFFFIKHTDMFNVVLDETLSINDHIWTL